MYKSLRVLAGIPAYDEESKIGRNPLTSGKESQIVAIMPPHQYPREIWQELVTSTERRRLLMGPF